MSSSTEYQARLEAYSEGNDPLDLQSEAGRIVADLIDGVPVEDLQRRPKPDKWSIGEIIAHLAEDEIATSWRYRQMIENSGCSLASFDQEEWARLADYAAWNPIDGLRLFQLLREANLRMLNKLSSAEWERYGVHAERGKISVRDLARHMAGHDRNHIDQIRAILGARR
jgi:DinB family protein